jgi:hypothetical protein
MTLDQLTAMIDPADLLERQRVGKSGPYTCVIAGPWMIATTEDLGCTEALAFDATWLIQPPPECARTFGPHAVAAEIGEPTMEPCSDCDGTGTYSSECDNCGEDHSCPCACCDGSGKVKQARYAIFAGLCVNADYLAKLCRAMPPEPAKWWTSRTKTGTALFMAAGPVTAVLMPLDIPRADSINLNHHSGEHAEGGA